MCQNCGEIWTEEKERKNWSNLVIYSGKILIEETNKENCWDWALKMNTLLTTKNVEMNTETANYHQSNEVSSIKKKNIPWLLALLCVIFLLSLFARPAVEITSNNWQAQSNANYVPPTRLFVLINHVFLLKQTTV